MGACISSRVSKRMIANDPSNVQNHMNVGLANKSENKNEELQPYWTNYNLGKKDIDINKDPNIQNVLKTFGI
jgi:hypothetical protein